MIQPKRAQPCLGDALPLLTPFLPFAQQSDFEVNRRSWVSRLIKNQSVYDSSKAKNGTARCRAADLKPCVRAEDATETLDGAAMAGACSQVSR